MMKRIALIFALLTVGLCFTARAQEDRRFGGWEFVEINHDFGEGPFFASFYFEHDNFQYRTLDCWYTRTTLGVKVLPWLKADVAYDYLQEPSQHTHKLLLDLTGTLKSGHLKVSVRERYVHSWVPVTGGEGNVLRSRLKVQYAIPDTRWSPYLAVEVFTWGDQWKKTRHYVAVNYDFSEKVQLEAYYLYYAFNGIPAEHVLGIGMNFYL